MNTNNNILTLSLNSLGIRHSHQFTKLLYAEHPEHGNLQGIAMMLHEYGVQTQGIQFESPDQLIQLPTPYITQLDGHFVVVKEKDNNTVVIQKEGYGHRQTMGIDTFLARSTLVALVMKKDEDSGEKDFRNHRINDIAFFGMKILFWGLVLFFLAWGYSRNQVLVNRPTMLLFILCESLGLWVCWQLVQQQLSIRGTIGERLCRKISNVGCTDVLDSHVASLFGVISWSEIGFGYFCANLLLAMNEKCLSVVVMTNYVLLPFTLVSVWYQKYRLRHLCALCISVMVILWMTATASALFNIGKLPVSISLFDLFVVGCGYALSVIVSHFFVLTLAKSEELVSVKQALNRIKVNPDIFNVLLKSQPRYEVSDSDSHIVIGNPHAPECLTVFSNPYCLPCAKMHEQIQLIIEKTTRIKVRFIFTAFNQSLLQTNRLLIATFFSDKKKAEIILDEWFKTGRSNPEQFWKRHPVQCENPQIDEEIKTHLMCFRRNRLTKTPEVLFNGFLLPDAYSLTDLLLFLKCTEEPENREKSRDNININ